jgi:neutral ceramidase
VIFDAPSIGYNFGQILIDVNLTPYGAGETVSALFVGANPRVSNSPIRPYVQGGDKWLTHSCCDFTSQNNLRLEGTFLTIDQLMSGTWVTARSDSHPSTIYQWTRTNTVRLLTAEYLSRTNVLLYRCLEQVR